jgi:hypothetical protein
MISNSLKMMVDENTAPVINTLSVTKNGTYTAPDGVDGYSPITVDVQEQPWQPLEDGYSNFWFELTNDTLSPWLNFSAKTESAVIDWGDGSGEVALDTLTPTHTYSKAGRYVVKVKGVTGVSQEITFVNYGRYNSTLKHLELNSDIVQINSDSFSYCSGLEKIVLDNIITISARAFQFTANLYEVELKAITEIGASCFYYCTSLSKVTIHNTISVIGAAAFAYCRTLREIHIQATIPPTLGENAFIGLPANFIIYVPVGYGETYKAASGWSAYADHILEEGQSLSMAALRRIQAEKNDNGEEMR